MQEKIKLKRITTAQRIKKITFILLFIIVTAVTMSYVNFNIIELIFSLPVFVSFLWDNFLPPDFSEFPHFIMPLINTIFISIIATTIASTFAMVAAFLMARTTTPHPVVRNIVRGIVTFFRSVPFLLWAAISVIILGVGLLPGIVGLTLFGGAFLARVYAESIEEIDPETVEAVSSTGASYVHILKHAILPQFLPSFYSWTLFMFEINIRASAILGIVGAGGIGVLIKETMDMFNYAQTGMILLMMVVMILCIEYVTTKLRARLI